MSSNKLAPIWLFVAPIVVQAVLGVAGVVTYLSFGLHSGRVIGIAALVGAAIAFGILFQGLRMSRGHQTKRLEFLPFLSWYLLIGIAGAFGVIAFLRTPRALPEELVKALPAAVFLLAGVFAIHVVKRLVTLGSSEAHRRVASGMALWLTNSMYSLLVASLALILLSLKFYQAAFWTTQVLAYWILLLTIELVLRTLFLAVKAAPNHPDVLPNLVMLEAVFRGKNPFSSLANTLRDEYALDFGFSRIAAMLRRGLPLVGAFLVLALWGLSAFVLLQPHEVGIREVLGKSKPPALEPGIHLKYPWPFERVRKFPAKRLLSMTVGYEAFGQTENIIWSRPHGRKEHRFPVGNAKELISIDALMYYEISDVFDYAYRTQNPDTALSCLAYSTLIRRIVGSDLDELLSVDRASLSKELAENLNRRAAAESLGLHVVGIYLESIHPPFEVADAYQRVVSGDLAKEARILRAMAYRERVLPAVQAQADSLIARARADSSTRVGSAKGEASAFVSKAQARRLAPGPFDQHLRLGAMESALMGREFIVLDNRLSASSLQPWIDLRAKPPAAPIPKEDVAIPWDGEGALE